MFEFILLFTFTPVFLMFGVIPGVVYTLVLLIAIIVESSGLIAAVKGAMKERDAKHDGDNILNEMSQSTVPYSEVEAAQSAYKLLSCASFIKTDEETRWRYIREACLLHIDGWSMYAHEKKMEIERLMAEARAMGQQEAIMANDEGEDINMDNMSMSEAMEQVVPQNVKRIQDELEKAKTAPKDIEADKDEDGVQLYQHYASGDEFILFINAILPVTSPLQPLKDGNDGLTDKDGQDAIHAAEEAVDRFGDDAWADEVKSEMYGRVSLVWLCVLNNCVPNSKEAKSALRFAKLWSDMALDLDSECALGLLCRFKCYLAVGNQAGALRCILRFVECASPDRRDYALGCYEAAVMVYRYDYRGEGEGESDPSMSPLVRAQALVHQGESIEEEYGQWWKEIGLIMNNSKKRHALSILEIQSS